MGKREDEANCNAGGKIHREPLRKLWLGGVRIRSHGHYHLDSRYLRKMYALDHTVT